MNQIPHDKLATLYMKMMDKLAAKYTRGFYRQIAIFWKGLDQKITKADNEIDTIWEQCIEGKASLMEFIGALNQYEGYMLRGFRLYKSRGIGRKI